MAKVSNTHLGWCQSVIMPPSSLNGLVLSFAIRTTLCQSSPEIMYNLIVHIPLFHIKEGKKTTKSPCRGACHPQAKLSYNDSVYMVSASCNRVEIPGKYNVQTQNVPILIERKVKWNFVSFGIVFGYPIFGYLQAFSIIIQNSPGLLKFSCALEMSDELLWSYMHII